MMCSVLVLVYSLELGEVHGDLNYVLVGGVVCFNVLVKSATTLCTINKNKMSAAYSNLTITNDVTTSKTH